MVAFACALGACGTDDPPAPEAVAEVVAPERERPTLEFPDDGHPVVWVKKGERVTLREEPGGKVLETLTDETEFGSPTVLSVARQRDGWVAVPTAHFENGRLAWVRLDPRRLRAGRVEEEIRVDLSEFEATLLRDGKIVTTTPVSIGMPEAPTPPGEYAVTDTFRGGLNPAYGCCAIALTARQTRLPSGWLGGDRIAIHGTSGTLGAAISHGCVRAPDAFVNELVEKVSPGTPVSIRA